MIAIPASSGVGIDRDDTDLARATMRRVSLRLLPFLFLIYVFNFLDRTNVAIAASTAAASRTLTDRLDQP